MATPFGAKSASKEIEIGRMIEAGGGTKTASATETEEM
jgi:hypothetical protein